VSLQSHESWHNISIVKIDLEFVNMVAIQHLVARYPVLSSLSLPVRHHPECSCEQFLYWYVSSQQQDRIQNNR